MNNTKIMSLSGLIAMIALFLITTGLQAKADDAKTCMTAALTRIAVRGKAITDKTSFGYDRGISLLGGYIRPGSKCSIERTLQQGMRYAFLGAGDDDADAINIVIYNKRTQQRVAYDLDDDKIALVTFQPAETGTYEIQLRLKRADVGCFCALGMFRDKGWTVGSQNFIDVVARCMAHCSELANRGLAKNFLKVENQWSMFGGVVEEGGNLELDNMSLGSGTTIFSAAADRHASRTKLGLLTRDFSLIKQDNENDTIKLFITNTNSSRYYGLRLTNSSSDDPSFMMALVLK